MENENKPVGLAIASLVLGIISLLLSCCIGIFSLPFTIVGAVLGFIAMKKVKDGTGGGKGMAIAGIVTSFVSLVPTILGIILYGGAMMLELADSL